MSAIALENKTILVTGAAGFIGSNLVKRICEEVPSAKVVGIDSVNDYYDVALKEFRLNCSSRGTCGTNRNDGTMVYPVQSGIPAASL